MDAALIAARALHVVVGAFWVGAMIANAFFVGPAMRDAGPDGAKVAAALMRRGFMNVMPLAALITVVSGLWLYWKMSFGFRPEYMQSARGILYGAGGAAAIVGFLIGIAVMRPAMLRVAALGQSAAAATETERVTIMKTVGALRTRAARAGQIVALLLLFATLTMAIGRYVG